MRRIAIINQKGGVGKTTTAVNLGAALARAGKRVLLIDLDPQAHASLHLGQDGLGSGESVYEVLTGQAELSDIVVRAAENVWIAASHIDLAAAEMELAGVVGRELILRDRLQDFAPEVDYVLIDCPPSLGVLTLNALCAVDEVILPLQPHFLALHGLSKLLETIDLVARRLNQELRLTGVVLCMFDAGTRLANEVQRDAEEFFGASQGAGRAWSGAQLFATPIRRNIRLAEAPSFGQSIFDYSPNCHGAEDYAQLATEIMSGEPAPVAGVHA